MKVVSKQEDPLCGRTIYTLASENATTPSNAEVRATVAKDAKVDESLVVMKKIATHFGKQIQEAQAYAYKDAEHKARFEKKTKHIKEAEKKAAEEAAKAAEEAKKAAEEAKAAQEAAKAEAEKPAEEAPAQAAAEEKSE